jgi:hypothetical protein
MERKPSHVATASDCFIEFNGYFLAGFFRVVQFSLQDVSFPVNDVPLFLFFENFRCEGVDLRGIYQAGAVIKIENPGKVLIQDRAYGVFGQAGERVG